MRPIVAIAALLFILLTVTGTSHASTTQTLTDGQTLNLGIAASGDPAPDATADLQVSYYAAGGVQVLIQINGTGWYFSDNTYGSSTLAEALTKAYHTEPDGFIINPDPFDVVYVRTGTSPNFKYFKLRATSNNTSSITVEWDYLGGGGIAAPTTAWSVDFTYDLFAFYQDESTGTVTTHAWDFGDGSSVSSATADAGHHYSSPGSYNVCQTASNSGGSGGEVCISVPITLRPSTTKNNGQGFDFDGDMVVDLSVLASSCTGLSGLQTAGSAAIARIATNYITTDQTSIVGANYQTGTFCQDLDFMDAFAVSTSSGAIYKAWMAGNDGSSIRLEFDLLEAAPPPVPTSAFSAESYDLFGLFTDASSESPSGWSWTFGDGATDTAQSPRHHYSSAGQKTVCLTASNVGGDGNQVCQNLPITLRPSTTKNNGQGFDFDGDMVVDLSVVASTCAGLSGLQTAGSAALASLNTNYITTDQNTIVGANYLTGTFCPDLDFMDAFAVSTSSGAIYKAWMAGNDGSSIRIEFELLQASPTTPPTSAFSAESYDLFGIFTDASSESPSGWAWTFGDGATDTTQSPRHHYSGEGQRVVCLTASNDGGDGNQACQNLPISLRPSTTFMQGADFQLDADGLGDLRVSSGSCSSGPNVLETRNGAQIDALNADFRSLTAAAIPGATFAGGSFCLERDYLDAFLIQSSNGAILKAWVAANDGGGIRLEFEQLQASPTLPPVSSFVFDTYDLFAFFTDTSTDGPTSWSWDFGDASGSGQQDPEYRYASAGTRSVCLEASNAGGMGGQDCHDVTVSSLPSSNGASGEAFDLDGDGSNDLSVHALAQCLPLAFGLRPEGGASVALFDNTDYRTLDIFDVSSQPYASDDFCRDTDFRQPFIVDLGEGRIFRAWVAENDNAGIRLVFDPIGPSVFGSGFEE